MAEVIINGNVIDSTTAEHTYRDASGSDFIYINTHGDLESGQKEELYNLGASIQDYVSAHTYKCHYRNTDLEVIRRLPYVQAANVFEPAMKTDSAFKEEMASNPDKTEYTIEIQIHDNAPQTINQVAEEISRRTGIAVNQMSIGHSRIEVTVHRDRIPDIEGIDSVNHIEKFRPISPGNEYARGILGQDWDYSSFDYSSYFKFSKFKGQNQVVAVADTGVDMSHRAFMYKVVTWYDYNMGAKNWWESIDPNGHGTHVAGSVVDGVASHCKIIPQNTWNPRGGNDGKGGMGFPNPLRNLFLDPYDKNGCRIHTNSWGINWSREPWWQTEQGGYDGEANDIDSYVVEKTDLVILFCAHNDGGRNKHNGEVQSQATAKNVITVGNCSTLRPNDGSAYAADCVYPDARRMNPSSSTGPTLPEAGQTRGRIKPDVVAPGTAILSALSKDKSQADRTYSESFNGGKYWDNEYCYLSGTSMATPHVAGCCAVLREALMSKDGGNMQRPSASLIKALLVNGTVDLKGHRYRRPEDEGGYTQEQNLIPPAPNGIQGFGRVDLTNSLQNVILGTPTVPSWSEGNQYVGFGYQDAGDANPDFWERSITEGRRWATSWIPLKYKVICATLCYPDPPGKATLNVLNLIVRTRDSTNTYVTYERHGNSTQEESRWDGVGRDIPYDMVNNVEKVVWENPSGNEFQVEVWAQKFFRGRTPGPSGNPDRQSWAMAWMCHN